MTLTKQIQGVELSRNNNNISSCCNKNGGIRKTLGGLYSTAYNKTVFLSLLLTLALSPQSYVYASDFDGSLKGVTITDSGGVNTPPTAVIHDTQNGDTFEFDASLSTDTDGTITEYRWDFGDGNTGTGVTATHTYSTTGSYPVTLSVTDDQGGIALSQMMATISPPFQLNVNFQPISSEIPIGFVADSGLAFDENRGYGWTTAPASSGTRDRDSTLSPDETYDTMIHSSPLGVWKVAVPGGEYTITICMGDASYPSGIQNAQVEGVSIVTDEPLSNTDRWIVRSLTTDITDGKLTFTFIGSTVAARICWIKITSE